ncbi:hypothetical protein BKA70DRAFT_1419288 [Coprinopsis sp. MPI-PUGE-AT-0042]|nr:hypothetical protein BKA70DRAFT_1419288 [Coprinopsis sp. MPI-PUGE-AT-0042]
MVSPGLDEVPDEIWRLIASEVVEATTLKEFPAFLMSINRHFFNFYLDQKYEEVHWTKLDAHTVRELQYLQSPVTATRVRRLRLHAWFIEYLISRDKSFGPTIPSNLSRWRQGIQRLLRIDEAPPATLECAEEAFAKSFAQGKLVTAPNGGSSLRPILNAMISATKLMTNVISYTFELRDLPFTKDTELFLSTARLSFGSNLRKLTLHTNIPKFHSVFQLTDFEHLDDLDLHFDYSSLEDKSDEHLMKSIAPFVNSRRDSLTSLAISSASWADLSPFFSAIGPFPSLRKISLHIYFDATHLSNPASLLDFLCSHDSTLLHVELRQRTPDHNFKDQDTLVALRERTWEPIHRKLAHDQRLLRNMESLMIPCMTTGSTLPIIQRSLTHLESLSLLDRKLDDDELDRVLRALAPRSFELRHLHVEVRTLTEHVLEKLSKMLPGLRSLVLVYASCDREALSDGIQHLKVMGLDWGLEHLSVFEGRCLELHINPNGRRSIETIASGSTTSNQEVTIMKIMSSIFTTIKTFKGCRVRRL